MLPIKELVSKYQAELRRTCALPGAKGARCLGEDGCPSRAFFLYLTGNDDLFFQFLWESGLIRRSMKCDKCGREMAIMSCGGSKDGFAWGCNKATDGNKCRTKKSIRHTSWFTGCNMTMGEVLILTYELLHKEPTKKIMKEYGFSAGTLADWGRYIKEAIVGHVMGWPDKIGGRNVVVEVSEAEFERYKRNDGEEVDKQWVLGGVERGSGRCFLVPVADRRGETLVTEISKWVHPESTVMTDSLKAYDGLKEEGFEHLTVKQNSSYRDSEEKGVHTNSMKSVWRHVKEQIVLQSRLGRFDDFMADYMFRKRVEADNEDLMNRFIEIVRAIDWSEAPTNKRMKLEEVEEECGEDL